MDGGGRVAAERDISTSTVKFHIARLMTKIGVRNRVELAMWVYETGRIPPTADQTRR